MKRAVGCYIGPLPDVAGWQERARTYPSMGKARKSVRSRGHGSPGNCSPASRGMCFLASKSGAAIAVASATSLAIVAFLAALRQVGSHELVCHTFTPRQKRSSNAACSASLCGFVRAIRRFVRSSSLITTDRDFGVAAGFSTNAAVRLDGWQLLPLLTPDLHGARTACHALRCTDRPHCICACIRRYLCK